MKPKLSHYYEAYAKHLKHKDWNTLCGMVTQTERDIIKQYVKSVHRADLKIANESNGGAKNKGEKNET